jgi:hypothetical protein
MDTAESSRFGIGAPLRRVEDFRFLTGAGRYTDDIDYAGGVFTVKGTDRRVTIETVCRLAYPGNAPPQPFALGLDEQVHYSAPGSPSRTAPTSSRSRSTRDRACRDPALHRDRRFRRRGEPPATTWPGARRTGAGRGPSPRRGHRLRPRRPASDRLVPRLPDAARRRVLRVRDRNPPHAGEEQPARRQGRGRIADRRRAARGDERRCRRAGRLRHHRHAAVDNARARLARDPRRRGAGAFTGPRLATRSGPSAAASRRCRGRSWPCPRPRSTCGRASRRPACCCPTASRPRR